MPDVVPPPTALLRRYRFTTGLERAPEFATVDPGFVADSILGSRSLADTAIQSLMRAARRCLKI